MAANYLFDQQKAKAELLGFFKTEKAKVNSFGSTVNQTFEAQIFARVIKKYRASGWTVSLINPLIEGKRKFKLKFNTKGAPKGYSYAYCVNAQGQECQIRHGLRVRTKSHKQRNRFTANIVCDIVIMNNVTIDHYKTGTALPNSELISFGEVKHMYAFAELIASFLGLIFEIQPNRLKRIRNKTWTSGSHVPPFLYVSGKLYPTALGIQETITQRKFDVDIYSFDNQM